MLIFGIAFGRPPVPISRIWGPFQGAFWCHFEHFFADAANLRKCNLFNEILVLGGVGPPVLHYFANFLHVFFMLLSRKPFCSILADLGLQRGSFRSICLHILQIFHEKNVLKLRHANEAFLALIWRGRRRGEGPA